MPSWGRFSSFPDAGLVRILSQVWDAVRAFAANLHSKSFKSGLEAIREKWQQIESL